jgi:prolipoprotein diacylglyceryltransferase
VTFPVHITVLGHPVHPHLLMELIAYAAGFQLYQLLRRRRRRAGDLAAVLPFEQNVWLIVGCVFGALAGSRLLAWVESANLYWSMRADPRAWLGGKTIVGGLLGGWIGVEIAKRRLAITRSTGDLFVFPLIVGMSIGRVGCFLTGLDDHTYGVETPLPWGVDFGDGIRRHPTQLYDIVVLILIGLALLIAKPCGEGRQFRWFMLGYLGWRFLAEFIKPREIRVPALNLSAIQIASLAGALVCGKALARTFSRDSKGTAAGAANEAS